MFWKDPTKRKLVKNVKLFVTRQQEKIQGKKIYITDIFSFLVTEIGTEKYRYPIMTAVSVREMTGNTDEVIVLSIQKDQRALHQKIATALSVFQIKIKGVRHV